MKKAIIENAALDALTPEKIEKMPVSKAKGSVDNHISNTNWHSPQARVIGVKYQPTMKDLGVFKNQK